MRSIPLLLAAALLSACSGMSALNVVTSDRGYEASENIAYARGPGRRLDLYVPVGLDARAPVVIFLHGGRWTSGSKDDYRFVGDALTSRGMIAVVPDYRKYPDVRMDDFMEDVAKAVVWVRDNIAAYGGDPEQIFLMGHSSGAQMASLLAYNPSHLQRVGVRERPKGFIGLAGAYDFLPLRDPDLLDMFGPEDAHDRSQPINYAGRTSPPTLLIHAENDVTARLSNAENLANRLSRSGAQVSLVTYDTFRCAPGVSSHACTVMVLARPYRRAVDVLDHIEEFVVGIAGRRVTTSPEVRDPAARTAPVERGAPRPVGVDDEVELQE